jgi:hypothetical protein
LKLIETAGIEPVITIGEAEESQDAGHSGGHCSGTSSSSLFSWPSHSPVISIDIVHLQPHKTLHPLQAIFFQALFILPVKSPHNHSG